MNVGLQAWPGPDTPGGTDEVALALERGNIVLLPSLSFDVDTLQAALHELASHASARKNISYDAISRRLRGSAVQGANQSTLTNLLVRYHEQAINLIKALAPRYADSVRGVLTNLRPIELRGRRTTTRHNDALLHVDALPSRPTGGSRILRVFSNVNPISQPRIWNIGPDFEQIMTEFAPRLHGPAPGAAALLAALHVTRYRRSPYDHYMLALHDAMKYDARYQHRTPRARIQFEAGSTWICFSDALAHAAISGQYSLDTTMFLPVAAMLDERYSPLRILENKYGRPLA